VDVADRHDEFVVTADLPGIRKQDIDVAVKKDRVQITVDPDGPEGKAGSFARTAREWGPLTRTIRLPERVNERRTDADYLNGRLRIVLPKRKRRRSIDVE
jgi:HSP20 family protein